MFFMKVTATRALFAAAAPAIVAGLVLLPATGAQAIPGMDPTADYVQASLVAEQDGVAPGGEAHLALRLRHAPHWHTYWVIPGDAGLPTRIQWKLDPGYVAGPIEWPAPQKLPVGNLANYGFEGEVLLPVTIRIPAGAVVGSTANFTAHADWLVCSDQCIPGGHDLSLPLPIRAAADLHASADAPAFAYTKTRIPLATTLDQARVSVKDDALRLAFTRAGVAPKTLEFFPLEAERIVPAADQTLAVHGDAISLRLQLVTPVQAGFRSLRGVLVADGGPGQGANGWVAMIDVAIPKGVSPAKVAAPGASKTPGAGSAPGSAASGASGAPFATGAATQALNSVSPVDSTATATATPAAAPASSESPSILLALAGAFLGGVILNLMPCVFPVLSLKLMALIRHRDEPHARLRAHGLAYAVGVVLSFLALAGALLALRAAGSQVGWGFQLQSPAVIAGLLALFFLIGLNLLGTFEFTLGSGLANTQAAQSIDGPGLRGSFATGVLATLVASPCTAPFMGAALGVAATQSAGIALSIFGALGAGMAAPYVVIAWVPGLLARLPRPGAWMERLKQLFAFPMFLTCVWLFWVLAQQVDVDATATVMAALVILALFAWALGLAQRGARPFRWVAGAAAVGAAAIVLSLSHPAAPATRQTGSVALAGAGAGEDAAGWSGWSPDAQHEALAHGSPVFVDFTAAWCITCQANKRLVLHDARVEAAFRKAGVVRMRADWTRRDDTITHELERFSRSGVPMYLLYDRTGRPHLFPEILSTQEVLDALSSLGSS
jgi:thiol:disulfide interchange protein DsbD